MSSSLFQVINRGATRISEVRLDINIPLEYEESAFATITPQVRKVETGEKSVC